MKIFINNNNLKEVNLSSLKEYAEENYIIIYDTRIGSLFVTDSEGNLRYLGGSTTALTLNQLYNEKESPYYIVYVYTDYYDFLYKLQGLINIELKQRD